MSLDMGYRKFVRALVIFIALLVPANLLVWELHTKKFFDDYDTAVMGDLARLGYMPEYGVRKDHTQGRHPGLIFFNEYNGQPVDMVVVGDSFSMGVGGGAHSFFQEHIIVNSGKRDFTVLSLIDPRDTAIEVIWKLLNTGILEKINPRYVLIESAERASVENFGLKRIDPGLAGSVEQLTALLKKGGELAGLEREGKALEENKPFFRFMTFANLKHPLYKALYMITDRPPGASVYKARLDRPLFSSDYPETLLYLDADIHRMALVSEANVSMLNRNMNALSDALALKGIKLYFMPPPDKYGLYAPYIMDNRMPLSPFFALMRKQDRRYGFIDAGEILSEALGEGVRDLYHQDDTHWSWKAPDLIFRKFRFEPLLETPGR